MDVNLSFILILSGLTGIHSITTVSKVSVKAGGSISIPCLYDSKYINHVKYLCKGYYWNYCSHAVRTDQRSSGKYSISDDKSRRIFTVTINDLTGGDTDYWCAVDIKGGSDKGAYFQLSVTRGTPSLHVDHQQIRAFIGDNITINCYYHNLGEIKWCRLGGSCVKRSSESTDGTTVTISPRKHNVFTVTMSVLRTESSGWYWCVMGGLQMPVNVIVQQSTTCEATTTRGGHSGSTNLSTSSTIRLTLFVLYVTVTLFILFMVKRHMQIKLDSPATTTTTATDEREVRYTRRTSDERPHAESEVEGM